MTEVLATVPFFTGTNDELLKIISTCKAGFVTIVEPENGNHVASRELIFVKDSKNIGFSVTHGHFLKNNTSTTMLLQPNEWKDNGQTIFLSGSIFVGEIVQDEMPVFFVPTKVSIKQGERELKEYLI